MSRFTDAPNEVTEKLNEVINSHFPSYNNCHFKVLMDSKRKKSKGKTVFASIKKADEKEKFFTSDNYNPDGVNFIVFIDGNVWDNITDQDKERLLYHELCHIEYDPDSNNPWKIKGHDFNGFEEEMRQFPDIFDTWKNLTDIADSVYD